MAGATCKQRVKTLNESGYARYDERTSSMLGDTCETLLDRHGGDLRNLREGAERGPRQERELLKDLAGKKDSPRLVGALVRVGIDDDFATSSSPSPPAAASRPTSTATSASWSTTSTPR